MDTKTTQLYGKDFSSTKNFSVAERLVNIEQLPIKLKITSYVTENYHAQYLLELAEAISEIRETIAYFTSFLESIELFFKHIQYELEEDDIKREDVVILRVKLKKITYTDLYTYITRDYEIDDESIKNTRIYDALAKKAEEKILDTTVTLFTNKGYKLQTENLEKIIGFIYEDLPYDNVIVFKDGSKEDINTTVKFYIVIELPNDYNK